VKTVICTKYGNPEVLQFHEIDKPIPKENEVLVKTHATTVTIGDTIIRSGKHPDSKFYTMMLHFVFGIRKPNNPILGMEIAGEIEAVGKNVTKFKMGDQVFGSTFKLKFGGYAEYKSFPEHGLLAIKPANLTYGEAATIPGGGMTALSCLRKGKIEKGQNVLVNGASGAVGTNAVQLAKYFGANVTGVCSTANIELVKSIGADSVIDYTQEDFTQNSITYDVIFDAVAKIPASKAKKSLKKTGKYLNVLTHSGSGEDIEDLLFLKNLIEGIKIKPVIDRYYPFEQMVEAHRYVDQGHKKGNVVINVVDPS
jgi:NADPH:quinone reductase-like Zn-dependent oxidoreductase